MLCYIFQRKILKYKYAFKGSINCLFWSLTMSCALKQLATHLNTFPLLIFFSVSYEAINFEETVTRAFIITCYKDNSFNKRTVSICTTGRVFFFHKANLSLVFYTIYGFQSLVKSDKSVKSQEKDLNVIVYCPNGKKSK